MSIKQKFENAKNKAKNHLPEIILATSTLVATSYAFYLHAQSKEKNYREIALGECCMDELKDGKSVTLDFDNCTIDLIYDPGIVVDH